MYKVFAATFAVLVGLWVYALYSHIPAQGIVEWHFMLLLAAAVVTVIAVTNNNFTESELEPYDILRRLLVAELLILPSMLLAQLELPAWKGIAIFSTLLVGTGVVWFVYANFFRVQRQGSMVGIRRKDGKFSFLVTEGLTSHEVMQRVRGIQSK